MATDFIYNDYLKNISSKYESLVGDISANYNFELGTDFELVICEVLKKILPKKFGVCRGFLVSSDGRTEGDDIIIYDRFRFPQIRLFDENDLAHKQEIPIEAAYAYIEAKNSLINGQDSKNKNRSFRKALNQVSKVKALVNSRETINVKNAFNPYISIEVSKAKGRNHWPENINPFFTAIISPQVKGENGNKIENSNDVISSLKGSYEDECSPDLIIAGKNVCFLPFVNNDETKSNTYHSPFYIEGKSNLSAHSIDEHAFSVGMCSLLYALDAICLGIMPWPSVIEDALNL